MHIDLWKRRALETLDAGRPGDWTAGVSAAKKWLIVQLNQRGRPYKVHNLGCGVVRITTDTDTCPCCKRKL